MLRYIFLVLSITILSNNVSADQSICSGVVKDRDISLKKSELIKFQSLHDASCKSSGATSTRKLDAGLDFVVKNIPIKFKLGSGSNKQKVENFCKNYDAWQSEQKKEIDYTETLSSNQINAFVECIKLTGKHALIAPVVGDEVVTVTIRRGTQNFVFNKIGYDKKKFSCTGVNDKGDDVEINKLSGFEINNSNDFTIECRRKKLKSADGKIEYVEGGEILIDTSQGDLTLPIPREGKYSPASVEEMNKQIRQIESQNTKLEKTNSINQNKINNVHISGHAYYFGQHNQITNIGQPRFDCAHWSHKSRAEHDAYAKARLCPNADKIVTKQLNQRSGNACGYNSFTMSCLTFPK